MQLLRDWQVSGEGVIGARPEGAPDAVERPAMTRPHVVGHMSLAGEWCVQLVVPVNIGPEPVRWALPPADAEKLAAELLEYAALIRAKDLVGNGVA